MTRHLLAFAAASALGAAAMPAAAQDQAPPAPAWGDPQAPHYPGSPPMPAGPDGYGAPFAHPLPPGAYPGGPGSYQHGPMVWHGEEGPDSGAGSGYWYAYQAGGASCGCPSYTWVPVPIETHYRYSAPLRHVEEVVEERVVRQPAVESKIVPARRATKYVKAAPVKVTKGKVVRSTK